MAANREILMKFITGQAQKVREDISRQGYKDDSPYRNNPSNTIYGTPEGTSITMDNVSKRLYATDNEGNSQILEPNSGVHYFPGSIVKEIPMAKYGGLLSKTITCSNCGWSWKAADGGNDVTTCHKCGNENKIMQNGGESDFDKIKEWYESYIESPLYKRNLENSGYINVDETINQRKSNIDKTKYVNDENRLGTYYQPNSNTIHHAPIKDSEIWSKEYESVLPQDSVLAHEFGHSVLDNSKSFFGTQTPGYNKYDYEQLISRNKNKKISRGANENYADQKALQYIGAKLGIYKPGYEEFTKEHLDKIPADLKDRALQNYSEEDLIWLMNNIAQNDNNYNLPIAQEGTETDNTLEGLTPEQLQKKIEENTAYQLERIKKIREEERIKEEELKKKAQEEHNVFVKQNFNPDAVEKRKNLFNKVVSENENPSTLFHEEWMASPQYQKLLMESTRENNSFDLYDDIRNRNLQELKGKKINTSEDNYRPGTTAYFSPEKRGIYYPFDSNELDTSGGNFSNNYNRGIAVHEKSHFIDNLFTEGQKKFRLNTPLLRKEFKKREDDEVSAIPQKDVDLINSLRVPKTDDNKYKYDYFTEPTEVRARLNNIRDILYNSGNKEILNRDINEEDLKSLYNNIDLNTNEGLKDLNDYFGKEGTIKLLNSISQNDTVNNQMPIAKRGGTWFGNADMMSVSNKYQKAGTVKKPKLGPGKYYTTTGDIVDWGTPEYERAYNRGEVLSEDGVRSEVTLDGGKLDEVVIKNNYKRNFWEKYRDKIIEEGKGSGVLGAIIGTPINAITSLPQLALMNLATGKVQRPSEAWGFETNEGWFDSPSSFGKNLANFGLDAVTDPADWFGVGELTAAGRLTKTKALSKLKNMPTSAAPELRQGLHGNGIFFSPEYLEGVKRTATKKLFDSRSANMDENLKRLQLLTSPKTLKAIGNVDAPIADRMLYDFMVDQYPSVKNFRTEVKKATLEANRIKKLNPEFDFSPDIFEHPDLVNHQNKYLLSKPEYLSKFVNAKKAAEKTIANKQNVKSFLEKEYIKKMDLINQDPILKNIAEESPQYVDDIYNHLKNPIKSTDEFVNDLIKQSNTFTRSMHKSMKSGEIDDLDFFTPQGRSMGYSGKNTIDVEGFPTSDVRGEYGSNKYKIFPNEERMMDIANTPLEQRWAKRFPNTFAGNENINFGLGVHSNVENDFLHKAITQRRIRNNMLVNSGSAPIQPKAIISEIIPNKYLYQPKHVVFNTPEANQLVKGFNVEQVSDVWDKFKPEGPFGLHPGYTKGFKQGGLTKYDIGGTTGTTVAEQYTQLTGKPWSTAKAEGLTDGSAQQNLALIERLKLQQQPVEVPPAIEVINTSDKSTHTKQMAQRVVQIAEERIKNNKYIEVPDEVVKAAEALGEKSANSCIGGVCDVLKEAGVMNTVDWSNTHFSQNAKKYGFTANQGWGVKGIENLEPGDVLQRNNRKNEQGNYYPGHAQIYLGESETGKLRFFDNFWKTERSYYKDEIEELLNPARKKTELSATIYKVNPYNDTNPLGLTPEEKKNYDDKKEFVEKESKSKASYKWSIAPNAKDYNETTKRVMDKFIEFANDNDKINDLVKKTGKSKDEIYDSLLNVFGELGTENNWTTSRGKGLGSRLENVAESVLTAFGGGKKLSVGPGQIKFNSIPEDLKEKFDIQTPNDLYDLDKVLPLMAAMDLKDKQVLENWGKNNTLSKNLFGWTRPEIDNADGTYSGGFKADQLYTETDGSRLNNGIGRYSPYLRNQYSSIASGTTFEGGNDWIPFNEGTMPNFTEGRFTKSGQDEMRVKYERDPGSYPYKVEQNWRENLNRFITPNEQGEIELNEVVIRKPKKNTQS